MEIKELGAQIIHFIYTGNSVTSVKRSKGTVYITDKGTFAILGHDTTTGYIPVHEVLPSMSGDPRATHSVYTHETFLKSET